MNTIKQAANPLDNLQAYTQSLLTTHNIPAVSLAIWHNGQLYQAAKGILNLNTGVEATTDAIFQIGSITKVMTACLIMRLVDQGKVDLDCPVKKYLRDFQIADPTMVERITVRHLLNHTSGIAGDYFPDDHGHSGNLIARFVDHCALLPVIHPVGEMHSYSNSAYAIAGRLVEVVSGMNWYQAMKEEIFNPLGLRHAIADPIDMIRHRVAVGHIPDSENPKKWVLPETVHLTLGQAPCGTTPAMSAADLITFARAHLDQGLNQQGECWLSHKSIQAMQFPACQLPPVSQVHTGMNGLGWQIKDYTSPSLRVIDHSGSVRGSLAMLQMIPESHSAFAILLNSRCNSALKSITHDLLFALTGVDNREPEPPVLQVIREQDALVEGIYESFDSMIKVRGQGEKLQADITSKSNPVNPRETVNLVFIDKGRYASFSQSGQRNPNLLFLQPDNLGRPRYLYHGYRLNTRL